MATPPPTTSLRVRLTVLVVVVVCLFAALFARLYFLQVLHGESAQVVASSNATETVYLPAPRGEILDRNGHVLVGNRQSEVVTVSQEEAAADPSVLVRLAAVLQLPVSTLKTDMTSDVYSPYEPVTVDSDVPESEVLYIDEHKSQFPGVSASTQWVRTYPYGELAANILGYVGQINAQEYKALKSQGYQPNSQIGQSGVEATYESVLRGTPGREVLEVNSAGQVLGVLKDIPPIPGHNVRLSIDISVQNRAQEALEQGMLTARHQSLDQGKFRNEAPGGAAVVENPKNGQVLALATEPTYNPEVWVGGISEANYQALQAPSAHNPLLNRAIQGEYAPGSTFKLVTATAGLKYGVITPTSIYDDTGKYVVGGQVFHDNDSEAAGRINVSQAITVSSDNFFNRVGALLWEGPYPEDALQDIAADYGFNARTGINLPGESPGQILSATLVKQLHAEYPSAYPYSGWYTGNNVQEAIGQDGILVTPIQLANAYAAFANGGNVLVPQIAIDAQTATGKVTAAYHTKVTRTITMSAVDRAAVLSGFEGVINSPAGTAYSVFANTPLIHDHLAGKTGTAEVQGRASTSVFVSWGPVNNPQYVVDAFVEQAGYGASVSAPIVRQIYEQLYHDPIEPMTYTGNTKK